MENKSNHFPLALKAISPVAVGTFPAAIKGPTEEAAAHLRDACHCELFTN